MALVELPLLEVVVEAVAAVVKLELLFLLTSVVLAVITVQKVEQAGCMAAVLGMIPFVMLAVQAAVAQSELSGPAQAAHSPQPAQAIFN